MDGIVFHRHGQAVEERSGGEPATALLSKQGDLEIMTHNIGGEYVVWLMPASDPSAMEFFFRSRRRR